MNVVDIAKEYWEVGAGVAIAIVGFSKKRITSVVDERINPALLTERLTSIQSTLNDVHASVSTLDSKVDALVIDVEVLKAISDDALVRSRPIPRPYPSR